MLGISIDGSDRKIGSRQKANVVSCGFHDHKISAGLKIVSVDLF